MNREINSSTRLLGAVGYPLNQSCSHLLMNRLCEQLDQNYVYLMYEVPPCRFLEAVKGLKAMRAGGFNVTMPYKQRIMEYLDEVDETADMLGAVNTVKYDNGRLIGYNTDYFGFKQAMADADISLEGKKVVVLGAGAVSGSVSMTMLEEGADRVLWINRNEEAAERCAKVMNRIRPGSAGSAGLSSQAVSKGIRESDIIINITPVGMTSYPQRILEFDPDALNEKKTVFDILYSPLKTPLLIEAERRGARIQNGIRMFMNQAKKAFEIWTDILVSEEMLYESEHIIEAVINEIGTVGFARRKNLAGGNGTLGSRM